MLFGVFKPPHETNNSKIHDHVSINLPRLYLPLKPPLTEASLNAGDYAEISSRFKAAHVKLMVWWVAKKTCECADADPNDP